MWVELTDEELKFCKQIGKARMANARRLGNPDKTAPTVAGTVGAEIGCVGEFAFAKITGLKWRPRIMTKEQTSTWYQQMKRDFGKVEIRSTPRADGSLLLNPKDDKAFVYVLAIVNDNQVQFKGWVTGQTGMKSNYYREGQYGRPLYYVPQSKLLDMPLLEEKLDLEFRTQDAEVTNG